MYAVVMARPISLQQFPVHCTPKKKKLTIHKTIQDRQTQGSSKYIQVRLWALIVALFNPLGIVNPFPESAFMGLPR